MVGVTKCLETEAVGLDEKSTVKGGMWHGDEVSNSGNLEIVLSLTDARNIGGRGSGLGGKTGRETRVCAYTCHV